MKLEPRKLKIIEDHHLICADLCARYARQAAEHGDERRARVFAMFSRYHRHRAQSLITVATAYHKMPCHA